MPTMKEKGGHSFGKWIALAIIAYIGIAIWMLFKYGLVPLTSADGGRSDSSPELQQSPSAHGKIVPSLTPEDFVKKYFRFVEQGFKDHQDDSLEKSRQNYTYAYNMLSANSQKQEALWNFIDAWNQCGLVAYTDIKLEQKSETTPVVSTNLNRPGCASGKFTMELTLSEGKDGWLIEKFSPPDNAAR